MYHAPDRSDQIRNLSKAEGDDLDIGWNDGVLSDGRPYRAESWAADQISLLTFFFSTSQIETYTDAQFIKLLEDEGLIEFSSDERYVAGEIVEDASGNQMWSVNVVIADENNEFTKDSVSLKPYV
jgi:hypothetical protein